MTTDLAVFDFNNNPVRVILRDGSPWFVASDVCRVLELVNVTESIRSLDDDETSDFSSNEVSFDHVGQGGQRRRRIIISESGLYSLIFKSRKIEAKRFRKWVTSEVLPTLRQTGHYSAIDPARVDEVSLDLDRVADLGPSLSLIREVRILHGIGAARRVWRTLPIPQSLRELGGEDESNLSLADRCRTKNRDPVGTVESWWRHRLDRGSIDDGEGWPEAISCGDLYQSYRDYCDDNGLTELGQSGMGVVLRRLLPAGFTRRRLSPGPDGTRPWAYDLPSLERCRGFWSEVMTGGGWDVLAGSG